MIRFDVTRITSRVPHPATVTGAPADVVLVAIAMLATLSFKVSGVVSCYQEYRGKCKE